MHTKMRTLRGGAIALRALDRREAGLQAQLADEDLRLLRDVGRVVVGQHLNDRQRTTRAEAAFHGFEHDVADAILHLPDDLFADDVIVPGHGDTPRVEQDPQPTIQKVRRQSSGADGRHR